MIEGSGEDTMDGEIQTARADAAGPVRYAQRLRPSGDDAGGNNPIDGLRSRVNTATIEGVADGASNPGLGETRVMRTPA
jgi:hypothetical protein